MANFMVQGKFLSKYLILPMKLTQCQDYDGKIKDERMGRDDAGKDSSLANVDN